MIVDKIERKTLLQIGIVGALFLSSILYVLTQYMLYEKSTFIAYLILIFLCCFIISFAIGPGT